MRLSLQLYTLREPLQHDVDGVLAEIARTGLEYVELAGTCGPPPAAFRARLDEHGLKVSGAHVPIGALEDDLARVVAECRALDNEWVIVPWVEEARRDWFALAQDLSALGRRLADEGLRLAYHNHQFELGPDEGLRTLIVESNPALVNFQFDLGWLRAAGEDPQEWLWEFGPRVPLVHLKDLRPGAENPHVAAGDGVLAWDEILPACEGVDVRFGAIEMDDPPTDPIQDVRRCIDYFHERGLN